MKKHINLLPLLIILLLGLSAVGAAAEIIIEEDIESLNPDVEEEVFSEAEEITGEVESIDGVQHYVQAEESDQNQVEYNLDETSAMNQGNFHDPVVRIGDITRVEGQRDNQLMGFGLVTGLAGTGDSGQSEETLQARSNVLREFGIQVSPERLRNDNTAAVIVTATLPPYVSTGDQIDVTVSSWGDASTLQGGTLLQTPLVAADGGVYAVAQGPLSIGGFEVSGMRGSQVRENHPTVGNIPGGALVERSLDMQIPEDIFSVYLDNPSFQTASEIVGTINEFFQNGNPAQAVTPGEIRISVPEDMNDAVSLIARINELEVRPDVPARVVINEREGTIAMTHNVRISTVSVQKDNLTVTISAQMEVDQPPPFSAGETVIIEGEEITIEEEGTSMQLIDNQPTIEDLVVALNKIGATSRDMIAIIKDIHAAGALHAELELR